MNSSKSTLAPNPPPEASAWAFGLELALADGISVPGLDGPRVDTGAFATVRLDVGDELDARWECAAPERTRQHGDDHDPLLTVDWDVDGGYLVSAPTYGRFLVDSEGTDVLCAPESAEADWHAMLVGQVLPLAATLRGFEVFHASGVVLDGRALLFSSQSRGGKSSLAVRLALRGARLLSDDAVCVDQSLVAYPGSLIVHVRPAEHELMTHAERTGLESLSSPERARFLAPAGEPAPIGGFYLLERATDGPWLERLDAVSPLDLLGATFNLSVIEAGRLQRQLDLCARIGAEVPAYRVRIGPGLGASELADRLLRLDPAS